MVICKFCSSKNVVKNGRHGNLQYYLCKECNHSFAEIDSSREGEWPKAEERPVLEVAT